MVAGMKKRAEFAYKFRCKGGSLLFEMEQAPSVEQYFEFHSRLMEALDNRDVDAVACALRELQDAVGCRAWLRSVADV